MVAESLRWTTRDLQAMPDDGGWQRHEIIDGELFVTRAPHIRHQAAAAKLQSRLEVWSEATGLGNTFQTPGLVLTEYDAVIPDLVWASRDCLATGIDDAGHFTTAPELVVEILSTGVQNEQRDKEIKLKLYSRHGVQEYWIVDWQRQTLAIYRRNQAQLQLEATLILGDTLTSPLLPGFSTGVSEIFGLSV
jgi:Uma2 family endonuclease